MAYSTLEDIEKALPEANIIQLTDDEGLGVVNQERVSDAIQYADQLIDGYLRGRYTLPLNPVPTLIKKLSIDLAVFHLYARRFEIEMPPSMMDRYKNAIKLLEQIQKGLISLGIESIETLQAHYETNKTEDDRLFSKEELDKF